MNRILALGILVAVAGVAQATTWTTVAFTSSFSTLTAVETNTPVSIKRTLTGATLNNAGANIVWNFNYDTPVAFNKVQFVIKGTLNAGSKLELLATEEIFNVAGPTTNVGSGFIVDTLVNNTNGVIPFTATALITIAPPTGKGYVTKDMNFVATGGVNIASIEQNFTAVPEPGTMAALGLGVAALLRRRKK